MPELGYFVDDLLDCRRFHLPVLSLPACRKVEVRGPHTTSADKECNDTEPYPFPEIERLGKRFLCPFDRQIECI